MPDSRYLGLLPRRLMRRCALLTILQAARQSSSVMIGCQSPGHLTPVGPQTGIGGPRDHVPQRGLGPGPGAPLVHGHTALVEVLGDRVEGVPGQDAGEQFGDDRRGVRVRHTLERTALFVAQDLVPERHPAMGLPGGEAGALGAQDAFAVFLAVPLGDERVEAGGEAVVALGQVVDAAGVGEQDAALGAQVAELDVVAQVALGAGGFPDDEDVAGPQHLPQALEAGPVAFGEAAGGAVVVGDDEADIPPVAGALGPALLFLLADGAGLPAGVMGDTGVDDRSFDLHKVTLHKNRGLQN
jgi:hypothetical protein